MKRIMLATFLIFFGSQVFATHFHIEKSNEGAEGFKSVVEKLDTKKMTYSLVCSHPGFSHNIYSELKRNKWNQYISETGREHNIIKIIKSQEAFLNGSEVDKTMSMSLDSDVIVVANLKDGKTIIDIYTGEDAHKNENLLNK